MCLIVFALDQHPRYRLVLAANRDEFHARPTTPAGPWADAPYVFGGRDLERGGSWLGVTRAGRVAALTNFRAPDAMRPGALSRGALVRDYLTGPAMSPSGYGGSLRGSRGLYPGYNLLLRDGSEVALYESRLDRLRVLEAGLYGLSNHLLDTPWPKVVRAKMALAAALAHDEPDLASLRAALQDRAVAPDGALPDTGVGRDLERALSPVFIAGERYGTRAITLLLIGRDGAVHIEEARFGPNGVPTGESRADLSPLGEDLA